MLPFTCRQIYTRLHNVTQFPSLRELRQPLPEICSFSMKFHLLDLRIHRGLRVQNGPEDPQGIEGAEWHCSLIETSWASFDLAYNQCGPKTIHFMGPKTKHFMAHPSADIHTISYIPPLLPLPPSDPDPALKPDGANPPQPCAPSQPLQSLWSRPDSCNAFEVNSWPRTMP